MYLYYRWQNTSLSITTTLEDATIAFILNFSKLCYHLVKSGNIKIAAIMQEEGTLHFPDLGEVTIDQVQIKIKNEKKLTYIFDIFNISNIFIFQKNSGARRNFRPDDRQPGWGQT